MAHINAIVESLRRPALGSRERARFATVAVEARRDGTAIGEFSAFVVDVSMTDGSSHFLVVSARHCVTRAQFEGATIALRVPLMPQAIDRANPPYVWETVAIPIDGWIHSQETDASVAPLPFDQLPENSFITAWERNYFVGVAFQIFSPNVLIFGRASLGDQSIVVRRVGTLATSENPSVSLEIEPDTRRSVRVYVVEANVTAGMSGGLVLWTNGIGSGENVALGLVHGYAYHGESAARSWSKGVDDESTQRALERTQMEVEAARNGLVYVIRGGDILPLIDATACRFARERGVPDPVVVAWERDRR